MKENNYSRERMSIEEKKIGQINKEKRENEKVVVIVLIVFWSTTMYS